jgi:hypothetical protein
MITKNIFGISMLALSAFFFYMVTRRPTGSQHTALRL